MHTTQTTHNRIYFSNVTDQSALDYLVETFFMHQEENEIYDLIQEEGSTCLVGLVLREASLLESIGIPVTDPDDLSLVDIATLYSNKANEYGVDLISSLFNTDDYRDDDHCEREISPDELYDLFRVLGHSRFTVDGIYSQWAVSSDKAQFGAHAGGTLVTARNFSVPALLSPELAEEAIRGLANASTLLEVAKKFTSFTLAPMLKNIVAKDDLCELVFEVFENEHLEPVK